MQNTIKIAIIVAVIVTGCAIALAIHGEMITDSPIDYQEKIQDGIKAGDDPFKDDVDRVKEQGTRVTLADEDKETEEHEKRLAQEQEEYEESFEDYKDPENAVPTSRD